MFILCRNRKEAILVIDIKIFVCLSQPRQNQFYPKQKIFQIKFAGFRELELCMRFHLQLSKHLMMHSKRIDKSQST